MKKTAAQKYLAQVRRRPAKNESCLQRAIVKWCRGVYGAGIVRERFAAIPNGWGIAGSDRKAAAIQGARLKAEGARAGMPDLLFFAPVFYPDAALVRVLGLEVKLGTSGRVSPAQKDCHAMLAAAGVQVVVVRNLSEAVREILKFYQGKEAGE